MALSEQNLELLPDYEQRIDVLKELKFIDENSTVLLKGRVACEVSRPLLLPLLLVTDSLVGFGLGVPDQLGERAHLD
jgi:antiviral helicase SKI2